MTDYLIKTDGTSSGLTLGSAISDTDAFEVQQAFVAPASTKHQTFAAIKTWIQSWIAKADVGLGNVTNSLQLVAANNLSDLTDAVAARANLSVSYGAARNRFYTFTDCVVGASGNITAVGEWVNNLSASAAALTPVAVGSLNALGVLSLDLGTSSTGRAVLWSGTATPTAVLVFGLGRARFATKAAIHTLSNGTDTYTTRLGFIDTANGESTDGVFFRYTDGVNSGKWQAVCRSNGVETGSANDTGVTVVADAWKLFEIDVNAAGTSVVFKIDGSTVATITSNIPTGAGRETGYGVGAIKSAGTTATSGGYVDYIEVEQIFTTPR